MLEAPPPPFTKVNDREGQLDIAGFIIARAGIRVLIKGAGVRA